jgi:Fe2+ transport system protein FeoA
MRHRPILHRWLRHRSSTEFDDSQLSLADLHANERGRVLDLCCGRLSTNRLISLGFTPGAEVDMTQNYGHGPLIVTVRGGSVAIGRGEARHIRVERLAA